MKGYLILILLILLGDKMSYANVEAISDPETISDLGKDFDEEKLLACIMLQIIKFESERTELKRITEGLEERKRKIKAIIISKCLQEISEESVTKILAKGEYDSQGYGKFLDFSIFSNKEFDWKMTKDEHVFLKLVKNVFLRKRDTQASTYI